MQRLREEVSAQRRAAVWSRERDRLRPCPRRRVGPGPHTNQCGNRLSGSQAQRHYRSRLAAFGGHHAQIRSAVDARGGDPNPCSDSARLPYQPYLHARRRRELGLRRAGSAEPSALYRAAEPRDGRRRERRAVDRRGHRDSRCSRHGDRRVCGPWLRDVRQRSVGRDVRPEDVQRAGPHSCGRGC